MSNCSSCPSQAGCGKAKDQCGVENNPLNKIKHVIGVMSGKGGVGKSSIATLIAKQLKVQGYTVGIMDADITGPSIPRMLQTTDTIVTSIDGNIIPAETKEGIKFVSINLMVEDETKPVVWRGPVIAGAIKQFWNEVLWGELDFLIIDMPPGTGDVPLTVGQSIPVTGMVMVSVPQDFISMIVAKSINMIRMMNVKVLGVVENMSYIQCPDCDKRIQLFEANDTHKFLEDMSIPLLGELPMISSISNLSNPDYTKADDSLEQIQPIVENILKQL